MKKVLIWANIIAFIVFIIVWGVMGIGLLNGDYDVQAEAYLGVVCIVIMCGCAVWRIAGNKCPHCGKTRLTNGRYCPHCGKEIE